MSTNWKAGDKAIYVGGGRSEGGEDYLHCAAPKKGTIYLVSAVRYPFNNGSVVCNWEGLIISGYPIVHKAIPSIDLGVPQDRFRRIVPLCDRNEREQTELRPHAGFWQNRP